MKFHKYDEEIKKDLRIYDIGAEDHSIFARVQKDKEIEVTILNEKDEPVYQEKSHKAAWASLVTFAKMVLEQDKMLQKELIMND